MTPITKGSKWSILGQEQFLSLGPLHGQVLMMTSQVSMLRTCCAIVLTKKTASRKEANMEGTEGAEMMSYSSLKSAVTHFCQFTLTDVNCICEGISMLMNSKQHCCVVILIK